MMQLIILPVAEQDLDDIWTYIAEENLAAAERVQHDILGATRRLLEFPLMGVARDELGTDMRMVPCGSYLIFYRPSAEMIEIVRVLHGRRDQHADLF